MNYKVLIIFFLTFSCVKEPKLSNINFDQSFENSGFALVSSDKLVDNNIIKRKIDERSLVIYQRNLKPNTNVKITNLINNKSVIAIVGKKVMYPKFYNSVVSKRIADEIDLNRNEPYTKVVEINKNSTFLANKTKTYAEERSVAGKMPVLEIGIKDLNNSNKKNEPLIKTNRDFKYIIKIADFYYVETAKMLKKRIKNELKIKDVNISKISDTKFRTYLGPFNELYLLKEAYNNILKLDFENIEIIKL